MSALPHSDRLSQQQAMERKESRGLHYTIDYLPEKDKNKTISQ